MLNATTRLVCALLTFVLSFQLFPDFALPRYSVARTGIDYRVIFLIPHGTQPPSRCKIPNYLTELDSFSCFQYTPGYLAPGPKGDFSKECQSCYMGTDAGGLGASLTCTCKDDTVGLRISKSIRNSDHVVSR